MISDIDISINGVGISYLQPTLSDFKSTRDNERIKMNNDSNADQRRHYEARMEQRKQLYVTAQRRMELERSLATPFARTKMIEEEQRKTMELIASHTPTRYDVDRASFSNEELMLFQERMNTHDKAIRKSHTPSDSSD